MEKYIQPLLTALLIGVGTLVGASIWQGGRSIVRLEEQMIAVNAQLASFKDAIVTVYSAADAMRDLTAIDARINRHAKLIDDLEDELRVYRSRQQTPPAQDQGWQQ